MLTQDPNPGPRRAWTPEELDAWLAKSRGSQGLPFFLEDPAIIAKLIALLTARGWPPPWASRPDDLDDDQAEAA